MEKMRILHVVSSLDKSAGVMSVIMNYYRHINKNNIQFDFLYFENLENIYKNEIERMGGKVYLCPNPKNIIAFNKYFNEFLKNQHTPYTAIHLHEVYLNSIILPIAKKHGIKNRIVHNHATRYSDKKINNLRNKILCIPVKKNANYFMACSKAAGAFLYGEKTLNEGKVHVVNNAIDSEKFIYSLPIREKVRNELQIQNKMVIGHVGRFNDPKNHVFLIRIFAEICKKQKNALLMLIGEGPLKLKIQKLVQKLGLYDQVLFLDIRNDVNQLMQAMDIFVLPSLYEGLPVAGVEAQASGLPCIISDTVTEEIRITDLVIFKSLNQSWEEWADEILNIDYKDKRYDTSKQIIKAGYNIKYEAQKLQEFYIHL